MRLSIATVKLDVLPDPGRNADAIVAAIEEAAGRGARLVHFYEGALSGYAPHDLARFDDYDWDALSCWGSFFVRADGVITGKLEREVPGVLIQTVDTEAPLYESTRPWRRRAMDGVLHSGTLVDHPRSRERTSF